MSPHLAHIGSGRSPSGSGCGAGDSNCLTVVNAKCGLAGVASNEDGAIACRSRLPADQIGMPVLTIR